MPKFRITTELLYTVSQDVWIECEAFIEAENEESIPAIIDTSEFEPTEDGQDELLCYEDYERYGNGQFIHRPEMDIEMIDDCEFVKKEDIVYDPNQLNIFNNAI